MLSAPSLSFGLVVSLLRSCFGGMGSPRATVSFRTPTVCFGMAPAMPAPRVGPVATSDPDILRCVISEAPTGAQCVISLGGKPPLLRRGVFLLTWEHASIEKGRTWHSDKQGSKLQIPILKT